MSTTKRFLFGFLVTLALSAQADYFFDLRQYSVPFSLTFPNGGYAMWDGISSIDGSMGWFLEDSILSLYTSEHATGGDVVGYPVPLGEVAPGWYKLDPDSGLISFPGPLVWPVPPITTPVMTDTNGSLVSAMSGLSADMITRGGTLSVNSVNTHGLTAVGETHLDTLFANGASYLNGQTTVTGDLSVAGEGSLLVHGINVMNALDAKQNALGFAPATNGLWPTLIKAPFTVSNASSGLSFAVLSNSFPLLVITNGWVGISRQPTSPLDVTGTVQADGLMSRASLQTSSGLIYVGAGTAGNGAQIRKVAASLQIIGCDGVPTPTNNLYVSGSIIATNGLVANGTNSWLSLTNAGSGNFISLTNGVVTASSISLLGTNALSFSATNSAPINATTPKTWVLVQLGGQTYKLPLYQ